ncbi:hypothetical protein D1007_55569 [Hordeum vulgare]|nr:hypothetical protein D1007_55569 [Hordeum vulgare]
MKAWHQRFLHDIIDEHEFWAWQRVMRAAERSEWREEKAAALTQCDLGEASTWSDNDDRLDDAFLTSDYTTEESEEKLI